MDMLKKMVTVLVAMGTLVQHKSNAAVYKVGDSAGWTTIGNIDYKEWAATKTFQLGDVILFEYNNKFHNVIQVTHALYKACNSSDPINTYTTGNDTITISTRGHHYFFCGFPGHCQAGQKVDINVLRNTSSVAPTPSALATPAVPVTQTPAPGPSKASPPFAGFNSLGVVVAVLAVLVPFLAW